MSELREMLKSRNYSSRITEHAIKRAMQKTRAETLAEVDKEPTDRITFAINFSPHLPSVSNIIHKHYRTLTSNPEMKRLFPMPPMVAFKQETNLKRMLCRAKILKNDSKGSRRLQNTVGLKRCLKPPCKMCSVVNESPVLQADSAGTTYNLHGKFSCETSSVIYKIGCTKCKVSYVGQTGRPIRKRIEEHLTYIRLNKEATGVHFNLPGHDLSHFQVQVIEHVKPATRTLRETREQFWIQTLGTKEPKGLNRKD